MTTLLSLKQEIEERLMLAAGLSKETGAARRLQQSRRGNNQSRIIQPTSSSPRLTSRSRTSIQAL